MTQVEKLIAGMRNNPRAVRFEALVKVMSRAGWDVVESKGSHVKIKKAGCPTIVGVRPHGGKAYADVALVEDCLRALE